MSATAQSSHPVAGGQWRKPSTQPQSAPNTGATRGSEKFFPLDVMLMRHPPLIHRLTHVPVLGHSFYSGVAPADAAVDWVSQQFSPSFPRHFHLILLFSTFHLLLVGTTHSLSFHNSFSTVVWSALFHFSQHHFSISKSSKRQQQHSVAAGRSRVFPHLVLVPNCEPVSPY